jgi:hypothetical protein
MHTVHISGMIEASKANSLVASLHVLFLSDFLTPNI